MLLTRRNYLTSFGSYNQLGLRCISVRAKEAKSAEFSDEVIEEKWKTAKLYESIPGPSAFSLFRGFMPGGKFQSMPLSDFHQNMRDQYGDIYKMKGFLGNRDIVVLHDPKDFETIYRTEGGFPTRRGFESVMYFRKVYKKDKYTSSVGLLNEQGQAWWDLRHKVNGVMMKPQITKGYTSAVDEVSTDFVKKIHNLRDSNMETPADFMNHINIWSLEAISYIILNIRLGLLSGKPDEGVDRYMGNLKKFVDFLNEFDFQPSIWKFYKTPKFNYYMKLMDEVHDYTESLVQKGLANLKEEKTKGENGREKDVLQKLYEIDKDVAVLMALDSLQAGIETTSLSTFAVIYNLAMNQEKQNILREELVKILPEKDSPLTAENMANLPYLRACIKEALRLNPVINSNLRTTGRNIIIKGYQMPKDTDVGMYTQFNLLDGHYFPEPTAFRPERWLKSSEKHENYNPFVYLPFGFGSRNCVGRRFAELEIESLVTRLVRNYYVEWHHPPLQFKSTFANVPQGDIKFRLRDY